MDSSDDKRFADPKLVINRVYTKKGDKGATQLVGGQKVPKSDRRIEAYGTVDELNAFVGVARQSAVEAAARAPASAGELDALAKTLLRVQHELFNLGSLLATLPEDVHPKQARVTDDDIAALEQDLDRANDVLPMLRSFVLPGGSRLNADLHVARTVCRRAERLLVALIEHAGEEAVDLVAVRYLNRLSDAFFVWSRYASHLESAPEVLWAPNQSASGSKT
ncbi:MAG: cob(I)yrinic acid a,c-diamide adenosyltransferase [Polyangiaceae bacterium]|nr:cob(I)yrinic acid a,c-diamide adenosyltransferase [Polyangiaceae bacterium]